MNNRYQNRSNNNNFRGGDNRRNNYQNSFKRNVWSDRNRPQNEWRSERDTNDSRNANRNENRRQYNPNTHLPGIPLNRNQSSTPFHTAIDNNSANGSGDQSSNTQIESISRQLTEIDLKVNDSVNVSEEVSVDSKAVNNESLKNQSVDPQEIKKECESETKIDNKVDTNNGNNSVQQRRNTIGTVDRFQSFRQFRRSGNESNQMNVHKFERFPNNNNYQNNRMQFNDQNKRKGGTKRYSPPKTQYMPNYIPVNPYPHNVCDTFNPYSQYLIQSPYYSTPINYGVPQNQMMAQKSGEINTEVTIRKQNDSEQSIKQLEQTSNKQNEMSSFLPFEPSAIFPVPPNYYGNIISYNTTDGMLYYFICVVPPNIAPLLLEQSPNGDPILPSNCHQISFPSF